MKKWRVTGEIIFAGIEAETREEAIIEASKTFDENNFESDEMNWRAWSPKIVVDEKRTEEK